MTSRRQRGQVLVLFALMATVLIGFVGLVLDGGQAAADTQAVRNAADGAALAAIYQVRVSGSLTTATAAAGQVVSADGLPSSDLTMTYLDSGGAVTSSAAAVATAQATVSHLRATFFLDILGIASERLTATAAAGGSQSGGSAVCAVCVLGATGTTLDAGSNAGITITGAPLIVNSTGSPSISLARRSTLTAPSITIAGGSPALAPGASISPAPVSGAPVADPFASLAPPSVAGAPTAYVAPAGSSTIAPGIYSSITVAAGSSVTLSPGTYVLTGPLSDAGTVTGGGVLLYLACSTYPVACGSGVSGAAINVSGGGNLTITAPASGAYAGMAVFADRNNSGTNGASASTLAITGSWYTAAMQLRDTATGGQLSCTQMVLAGLHLANSDVLRVSYSSGAAFAPSAFGLTS